MAKIIIRDLQNTLTKSNEEEFPDNWMKSFKEIKIGNNRHKFNSPLTNNCPKSMLILVLTFIV